MNEFIRDFAICPICEKEFAYDKVASTAIKVSSYDLDLKPEYRGVNVLLYSMVTCPDCYFTFQESDKNYIYDFINETNKNQIEEFLLKIKMNISLDVDNTSEKSENFFESQILIASNIYSILNLPSEVIKVLIKLSWLYREQKDEEKELGVLYYCAKIIENYYEKFNEDDFILSSFYLGYIYYRFQNKKEAANILDSLIRNYNNPKNQYLKAAKFLRGELN